MRVTLNWEGTTLKFDYNQMNLHTRAHVMASVCTHTHARARAHTHTHTHTHIHTHTHTHTHLYPSTPWYKNSQSLELLYDALVVLIPRHDL